MGSRRGRGGYHRDRDLDFETSKEVKAIPSFEELGLKKELLRGIYSYGKYSIWKAKKVTRI